MKLTLPLAVPPATPIRNGILFSIETELIEILLADIFCFASKIIEETLSLSIPHSRNDRYT